MITKAKSQKNRAKIYNFICKSRAVCEKALLFFFSHRVWIFYQSQMTNSFFNPHFHWYHKSFYTKLESCQKPFSLFRAWDWKKLYRPQLCFIIYAHRIAFAVEFFVWVELSVSQSAHISIFHTFITPE